MVYLYDADKPEKKPNSVGIVYLNLSSYIEQKSYSDICVPI